MIDKSCLFRDEKARNFAENHTGGDLNFAGGGGWF